MAYPDPPSPSNTELLDRSREGDHHAFRQLVERFHARLLATAMGMLGDASDAEEVVQESFVRFYRAIDRFEGRSSLATYLTRITMNEALKVIRKNRRWKFRLLSRDDPDAPAKDPVAEPEIPLMEAEERAASIRNAVQSLKPEFREVVALRFMNAYSTAECARILRIPQGTVMSRLSRALDKLGPSLQHLKDNA